MLIVALVLAVIGLASLVTAVVTSNELVAWVCIAASVLGVILLIIDALRERQRGDAEASAPAESADAAPAGDAVDATYQNFDAEYPEDADSDTELVAASHDTVSTETPAETLVESAESPAQTLVESAETPAETLVESADDSAVPDDVPVPADDEAKKGPA